MAARARSILLSERRRMMALLKSTEFGRQRLQEMPKFKPDSLSDVDLEDPGALQEITERALHQLLDGVLDVLPGVDRTTIETVTVDTDTTSASTRSFPDGSHLIMVSDAMMTLVDLLGALLSTWSASKGRTRLTSAIRRTAQAGRSSQLAESDLLVLGGAATLRYYIVHQKLWASSAKVFPRSDTQVATVDPERGFGAWALFYLLAHELGHITLRHSAPTPAEDLETQRCNELAADDFAYQTCTKLFGGGKDAGNITAIVATIAQSAIAISTDPLFVRSPETHPPFRARLDRIARQNPKQMHTAASGCWGLAEMVSRGITVATPLPERYWTAMLERPEFDTRQHSEGYFKMIRGMDMVSGYTPTRTWNYIEAMTEDDAPESVRHDIDNADIRAVANVLGHLARGDIDAAVDSLGVFDPAPVLDKQAPLSFHALVEALLASNALGGKRCKQGFALRTTAFALAHLAAPLLARKVEAQHE